MNHPLSDGPLPYTHITLCQRDYREFACSRATADWLIGGAMTHLDGIPVRLQIMDELVGGHNVMVKIWGTTPADEAALDRVSPRHLQVAA